MDRASATTLVLLVAFAACSNQPVQDDAATVTDAAEAVDVGTDTTPMADVPNAPVDAGPPDPCAGPGSCPLCIPGSRTCDPLDLLAILECNADGSQWHAAAPCEAKGGAVCFAGACAMSGAAYAALGLSMGSEFWATDLDNGKVPNFDTASAPYAVALANATDLPVTFTVTWFNGGEVPVKLDALGQPPDLSPIAPGTVRTLLLPPMLGINGTGIARNPFHIVTSSPVSAYQFNPLTHANAFSADASLLLPQALYGKHHLIMTREQTFEELRGFLTVVAVAEGATTVRVTLSQVATKTLASSAGDIQAMKAGESKEFKLERWDTLNIETDAIGADLTGTLVDSDEPVAVWAGSEAANAPNTDHCDISACSPKEVAEGSKCGHCEADVDVGCFKAQHCSAFITCCADHLEMQMVPMTGWGAEHVAVKLWPRGKEADYWRILAAADGTTVATYPVPLDMQGKPVVVPTLDKGEWFEIETTDNFVIKATDAAGAPAPVLVGHFMASQNAPDPNTLGPQPGDAGIGDPAFLLAVPVSRWPKRSVFLTPSAYGFNYVTVVAQKGAAVELDGKALASDYWTPLTDDYKWTRLFVGEGYHAVVGDAPVAVEVYGWDQYVSYGYPAGLRLWAHD